MLSTLLGFAYTKKSGVSSKMFNDLFLKQEQAINHAKTIMKQFDGNNPAQQESSTTVYRLVEELNNFLEDNKLKLGIDVNPHKESTTGHRSIDSIMVKKL